MTLLYSHLVYVARNRRFQTAMGLKPVATAAWSGEDMPSTIRGQIIAQHIWPSFMYHQWFLGTSVRCGMRYAYRSPSPTPASKTMARVWHECDFSETLRFALYHLGSFHACGAMTKTRERELDHGKENEGTHDYARVLLSDGSGITLGVGVGTDLHWFGAFSHFLRAAESCIRSPFIHPAAGRRLYAQALLWPRGHSIVIHEARCIHRHLRIPQGVNPRLAYQSGVVFNTSVVPSQPSQPSWPWIPGEGWGRALDMRRRRLLPA